MSTRIAQLTALLAPVVEGMGYEWVGCELLTPPGSQVLRVYIDAENGVLLDDCATVSRQLGAVLDVETSFNQAYTLEVSSPGVERPLFTSAHFQKVVGQDIYVVLTAPVDNKRKWKGTLVSATETEFTLELEDQQQVTLDMALVEKAHLSVKW